MVRRQLRRIQFLAFFEGRPRYLIEIEAWAGAHHWGRWLLELGHDVRLMAPSYVKPYVKRNKTDANDAEAICKAVTRPSMRFAPIKSEETSAVLVLHRARDFLVGQVTQVGNAIRAHMGLCCTNGVRDSLIASSGVARVYEQLVPYEVQDQELAFVQHSVEAARFAIDLV